MTPAKKTGRKSPAKKGAAKKAAGSGRGGSGSSGKKVAKKSTGKSSKKSTKKPAGRSASKAAKKAPGRPAKEAAGEGARKGAKNAAAKKPSSNDHEAGPAARLRNLQSQDLIHALASGLVRIGDGMDRARDEIVAGAALARRAAAHGSRRIQEAGSSAKSRLGEKGGHAVESTGETIATARGVSVGTLMRMGEFRDSLLVRLSEGTEELATRAREAREKGQDFYSKHREEIIALTITAIKIAAVIGVRRLTAPRKKGPVDKKEQRKADVVAVVGNLLGQVGKLLAHQPSALPLLREVYRKGDPGEQAVVGLLLAPTLHQDPEHALEVIEEFLEGASEEPAADTIARRTLAPLLREHPELVEQLSSWMRAAAPLVKRGALIALSSVMRDRRSRVGDLVAASVIVLEDHDEEVREALAWFMKAASDVDLEMTARTIADWVKGRGADVEEVVKNLPDPLKRRVRDLARDEGPSGWDG